MTTPRFYLPQPLRSGDDVALPDALFRHVVQVLRLRPGAALTLFNGDGGEYAATLAEVGRRAAAVSVGAYRDRETESPLRVVLAQALAPGERMDFVLQKSVELGVAALQPLYTERSVGRIGAARLGPRLRHWRGVVAGACEQCGRNRVPPVAEPRALDDWLAEGAAGAARGLALHPAADAAPLTSLPRPDGAIALLIGPAGGFSAAELAAARRRGFSALRLGPRVLRTETAGPAALAALQTLWGDF